MKAGWQDFTSLVQCGCVGTHRLSITVNNLLACLVFCTSRLTAANHCAHDVFDSEGVRFF